MIKKLKARYEAHANSEVELAPGLTVLLGDNDKGKSALQRALRWVARNDPSGTDMIPWTGKKEAEVSLENDTTTVTRYRGKENSYTVGAEKFVALKSEPPQEVFDALRIDDSNIQRQVDQYFLLQATPGVVAKRINKVAGIEASDIAIKKASELISDTNKEITRLKKAKESITAFLAQHKTAVAEAEEAFAVMKVLEEAALEGAYTLDVMERLMTMLRDSRDKLQAFPDLGKVDKQIGDIHGLESEVEKQANDLRVADALCVRIHSVDLSVFSGVDEIDISNMERLEKEVGELSGRCFRQWGLREAISTVDISKFSGLDQTEAAAEAIEKLASDIYNWNTAVSAAEAFSSRVREAAGKLKPLPDISLEPMEKLAAEIAAKMRKLEACMAVKKSQDTVKKLADELAATKEKLIQEGLLCDKCGQLITGEDTCDQ